MKATFVELSPFRKYRGDYLDDDQYRELQYELMANPEAGDVIKGAGGLRKMRFGDKRRGKGKRGGLRVIYYYWVGGLQFWMFTVYNKDEMDDLSNDDRRALSELLADELGQRSAS
jgi:hypothetical protein